jgi:hypothetical protein
MDSADGPWCGTAASLESSSPARDGVVRHDPIPTTTKESAPPTPITTCSPTPNLDLSAGSPALNTGNAALGSADFGAVDFNGNPRVNASGEINMGAYEQ